MSELPSGWQYRSIDSIVEGGLIADGDWVESKNQDPDGKVRLTQLADVGDGDFRDRSDRWMNNEQATRLNVNYLQPGDLLMARMPDPLGRTCMVPEYIGRAVTVVDVAIIRIARKDINPKFIMWLLNSPGIRQQIEMLASGTTRRRITRKNLGTIDLPIPPIDEQHKIVEILEDHLSRLDAAMEDIRRAQELSSSLTSAILFTEFDLVLGSATQITLGELMLGKKAEALTQGWSPKCEGEVAILGKEWAILKTTAIQKGSYDPSHHKKLPKRFEPKPSLEIHRGDFLITRKGPRWRCGIPTYVRKTPEKLIFPDVVYRFRVDESRINPIFLEYLLCSPQVQTGINKLKTGGNESGMNLKQEFLSGLNIPLIAMESQAELVAKVDESMFLISHAAQQAKEQLSKGDRLRRSLLQAAFTGRLAKEVASV